MTTIEERIKKTIYLSYHNPFEKGCDRCNKLVKEVLDLLSQSLLEERQRVLEEVEKMRRRPTLRRENNGNEYFIETQTERGYNNALDDILSKLQKNKEEVK